jgi:hypothetical protein
MRDRFGPMESERTKGAAPSQGHGAPQDNLHAEHTGSLPFLKPSRAHRRAKRTWRRGRVA